MTDDIAGAAKIASDLRNEGVSVQLYGEQKKFKKKMEYANKLGIPYVVIIGEDEIKEGKVSLKDMVKGEQAMYAVPEAAAVIRAGKTERGTGKCVISAD
jgi:histidyl-tRNA synthetase